MWFKNIKSYSITESLNTNPEEISQKLADHAFRHCGKQELASMGWVSPLEGGADLVHAADNKVWLTLKKQERLLPASVVNAELEEKVAHIEAETGAPLGKKAKQDLKQEIVHRLLPQAFTKNSYLNGMVDLNENLVLVDASADGKAEIFLAMLRKALGSLPVLPIARRSLSAELTSWIKDDSVPASVEIMDEAELKDSSEEGSIVRCKNQDLGAEEIINHIEAGKMVTKIAFKWDETLSAIIQDDCTVKRIKFTDVLKEQNDDIPKDQKAARLDADFALMSAELVRLVKFITETFALDEE